MAKNTFRSDCPVNYYLECVGDKWSMLIIRDLVLKGKSHYGEFLKSEENIATNILANRLAGLEENGIISKKPDPMHGSKYIYSLTKKGISLVPLLLDMVSWGTKYDKNATGEAKLAKKLKKDRESQIDQITEKLKASLSENKK